MRRLVWIGVGFVAAVVVAVGVVVRLDPGLPLNSLGMGIRLESIRLPPGFRIELFADGVEGARSLAVGERGTVFVGSRGPGMVYALPDDDRDGAADRVVVLAQGLHSPNGVAFRDGSLYVAEIDRILRLDGIESRLDDPPEPVLVTDAFPSEEHHGWKFIAFGPDGLLYVPVGAPCNACEPAGDLFATITRMRPDGSGLEVYARGVRNTVGFDWQPESGELWFTDNGRDWLGDDEPPDELDRAPEAGLHFGFPYMAGSRPDDDFPAPPGAPEFVPPALELGAHVAALGMRFYTGAMFPADYRGDVFIAEHGSWNRSSPAGYRVERVRVVDGRPSEALVFAQGWEQDRRAWGRPVDVQVMPDGALLVSDDRAGAVYRIVYGD